MQSTPIGTTIFRNILAQDKDAGVNGLVEYFLVEGSANNSEIKTDKLTAADGFGTFAIAYPHQGQVLKNGFLNGRFYFHISHKSFLINFFY